MGLVYKFGIDAPQRLLAGAVCAFGVFDGVHRGHAFLLEKAREQAVTESRPFIVLTFDIDPDERFHPDRLKKLMSNDSRIEALSQVADAVCVLPFTTEFGSLEPEAFLDATFLEATPAALHMGEDLRFGSRAAGTVADMACWGQNHGMQAVPHELLLVEGEPITATRIRLLLESGIIHEANELLGHRYALEGTVQHGRGAGADMGFRTANIVVPEMLRVLGEGVYAAYAHVGGKTYKAAVNVGVSATFADAATATVEAHLLDFQGDLYGTEISLEFTDWLRSMRKFDDVEELVATVMGNIDWVRRHL